MHAQLSSGTRGLNFGMSLHLCSFSVRGETGQLLMPLVKVFRIIPEFRILRII